MRAKVTAGLLLMMFFLLGWAAYQFQVARSEPAITGAPLVIEINKGDSFKQITQKLVAKQANISPLWFKAIALSKGVVQKLKTGEYELAVGLTGPEILDLFVQGKTKQYAITFPEGWAFKDWLQALAHNQNVLHTLANVDAAGALQILAAQAKPVAGMPSAPNMPLEGLFFPDTYYFDKQTTDVALLLRAYDKMQQVLAQEWQQKLPALPIKTPYEALILASIVEKETAVVNERPLIAGVFVRRLQTGMLLQTDPTVIYGMGEHYQGNITYKDLKTPTPYNTYVIKGLPPTPIAMPGREAINAALHPVQGDALYFVARGDGTHVFSASLKDHNVAVDTFQRKRK